MDVFKDLIDELKEENLLENTVVDRNAAYDVVGYGHVTHQQSDKIIDRGFSVLTIDPDDSNELLEIDQQNGNTSDVPETTINVEALANIAEPIKVKPANGREFYKKRAIGEMSNLQMVEHVLTGVEREYMRIVPKVFDDFSAKKSLNAYLQVCDGEDTTKQSEAEFAMMQETEAWCIALAERDKAVPVSNIRRYCENSRPALSSQALVALARFYRNLPYSELVRSKFDFVITRLFSRPASANQRVCLFTREEMLNHISLLYKEWSSVPLYTAEDDESKILLTALSFDELANEAENASAFDLLVANDFFGRLGMFKESVSELFFAPSVTAAAIDCNVRVGNAYISLIDKERVKMDSQSLYAKFGAVDNLTISDAASRTLEIVDILRKQREYLVKEADQSVRSDRAPLQPDPASEAGEGSERFEISAVGQGLGFIRGLATSVLSVNRWLLAASVILIAISITIFAGSAFFIQPPGPDKSVKSIELPDSVIKNHLKTARISGPNFYGLLLPSWDTLSKAKREDYIKIVFEFAKEKGCSQVNLLDSEGRPAGFASAAKTEIITR